MYQAPGGKDRKTEKNSSQKENKERNQGKKKAEENSKKNQSGLRLRHWQSETSLNLPQESEEEEEFHTPPVSETTRRVLRRRRAKLNLDQEEQEEEEEEEDNIISFNLHKAPPTSAPEVSKSQHQQEYTEDISLDNTLIGILTPIDSDSTEDQEEEEGTSSENSQEPDKTIVERKEVIPEKSGTETDSVEKNSEERTTKMTTHNITNEQLVQMITQMSMANHIPFPMFNPKTDNPMVHVRQFTDYCETMNIKDDKEMRSKFKTTLCGTAKFWMDDLKETDKESFPKMSKAFEIEYARQGRSTAELERVWTNATYSRDKNIKEFIREMRSIAKLLGKEEREHVTRLKHAMDQDTRWHIEGEEDLKRLEDRLIAKFRKEFNPNLTGAAATASDTPYSSLFTSLVPAATTNQVHFAPDTDLKDQVAQVKESCTKIDTMFSLLHTALNTQQNKAQEESDISRKPEIAEKKRGRPSYSSPHRLRERRTDTPPREASKSRDHRRERDQSQSRDRSDRRDRSYSRDRYDRNDRRDRSYSRDRYDRRDSRDRYDRRDRSRDRDQDRDRYRDRDYRSYDRNNGDRKDYRNNRQGQYNQGRKYQQHRGQSNRNYQRGNHRGNSRGGRGGYQNQNNQKLICHYCNKPNHVMRDCRSRKRDNLQTGQGMNHQGQRQYNMNQMQQGQGQYNQNPYQQNQPQQAMQTQAQNWQQPQNTQNNMYQFHRLGAESGGSDIDPEEAAANRFLNQLNY